MNFFTELFRSSPQSDSKGTSSQNGVDTQDSHTNVDVETQTPEKLEFKIEKNVPIFSNQQKRKTRTKSRSIAEIFPFYDMEVGDSFTANSEQLGLAHVSSLQSIIHTHKPKNMTIVTRVVDGKRTKKGTLDHKSHGTIRIWRTK